MTHPTHPTHRFAGTRRGPIALAATVGAGLLLGLVLGLVLRVPADASSAQPAVAPTAAAAPGGAWLRVGHFVPGMGATTIDLTPVGGSAETMSGPNGVAYGEATDYRSVEPGDYTATVRETSAPSGGAPMLSRSLSLDAGGASTLAVVGTSDQPRLVVLSDDLTPPPAGDARVRVLSASEAADSVTVTAVGGPVIAQDAVLGQTTGYAAVPAGDWRLELDTAAAGTASQTVSLASGSVYTVVVLDSAGASGAGSSAAGGGVELTALVDAAGAATAPRGGARTGGGGTAPAVVTAPSGSGRGPILVVGAATLVAAALLRARRRRTVPV